MNILKTYSFDEFSALSTEEQDSRLSEQCALFEKFAGEMTNERDRLVEEMYNKLTRITKRWALWNRKIFGPVVSREQVKVLLQWEVHNQPKFGTIHFNPKNTEIFELFEKHCQKSNNLLSHFEKHLYKLLLNFSPPDNEVVSCLDRCVHRWKTLVDCKCIDQKILSRNSFKVLDNILPLRKTDNDLILRLIPELTIVKGEIINIVRMWRGFGKPLQRPGTYKVQHDQQSSLSKYTICTTQLDKSSQHFLEMEDKVNKLRAECEHLKVELQDMQCVHSSLKQTLKVGKLTTQSFDRVHTKKSYQAELKDLKVRYSCQRIKFLNLRKQMQILNKQLSLSVEKSNELEKDLHFLKEEHCLVSEKFKLTLNKLTLGQDKLSDTSDQLEQVSRQHNATLEQLEAMKKDNITKQNMIGALQMQCMTLREENIERIKLVEMELNAKYNRELQPSLQRVKILENENCHQKQLFDVKDATKESKKECMFPDIYSHTKF